ncbi:MAG: dihydroneopterin aldolase [Nitrososphaerota archaeon]|nr:dihydroneopterin aldolase [Nitrososphaerota archaeon]MDG6977937.1 dihydroneopterin aldolase [Nitrososphaerota archaeon]MDG7006068.1 dihydroneopterin aldolase [Nitrososphaerota archaeon]MDG7020830.1 dihydroneopterin aldolase [Nitrososphaerota archaeon]
MDRIFIENLHVDCLVGVTEEERRRPQGVVVDVSIFRDLRRAAQTGKVGDTVDYREARRAVSECASGRRFTLLEGLAEEIASLAIGSLGADRVVVRVRKEKYSVEPSIGVEVERSRGA